MGRASHSRALGIWANGVRVGRWVVLPSGQSELAYDTSWITSEVGRPISLSLPMTLDAVALTGDRVRNYFDNLLPDSDTIRQRIRNRFHTRSGETIDLLTAIGRDCVGALQLLPEDEPPAAPARIEVTALSELDIERELLQRTGPNLVQDADEFRISLAGAQEKTGFTWHRGRFCRPTGVTPTTHIFKLPLGIVGGEKFDMRDSPENEWLCARILEAYGVPVASSSVMQFGGTKVLVVERFDRILHSSKKYWLRLVQEDFCQALGVAPTRKYEADGGPGLRDLARILQGSEDRHADIGTLMRANVLFWMLAATDGHAKNFSLQIRPQGRYRLAPLYDVLSAWPIVGNRGNQVHPKKLKMAMALRGKNAHYRWIDMHRSAFNQTAKHCGLGFNMEAILRDLIERTPRALGHVEAQLPAEFPRALFQSVTRGVKSAVRALAAMPIE
jgi:serine/threonine-protein kinase HipA